MALLNFCQRRSLQVLFVVLSLLTVSACSSMSERNLIRRGLLSVDISQQTFLNQWGPPTTTSALSGDELISTKAAGEGRLYFRGNRVYEIWDYTEPDVRLVFFERELVAWQTDQTVEQLVASRKQRTSSKRQVSPHPPG